MLPCDKAVAATAQLHALPLKSILARSSCCVYMCITVCSGCRATTSSRRHRPITARSNEIGTVASATLTSSQAPATLQPDGSVLSTPTSSRNQTLQPRQLRGREVEERALDCCVRMHQEHPKGLQMPSRFGAGGLDEAYDRCGIVTASYAKTFYLGTQLMTPEKAKAVWAVYVWCRRTDELVDGPNASRITPEVGLSCFAMVHSCFCRTAC